MSYDWQAMFCPEEWLKIVNDRIGNAKPTQRSVAYISQLILVLHASGLYEEAEPWIAACDQIVKQIEHQKNGTNFFVKIVAGPCWRVLELILHRAKKKEERQPIILHPFLVNAKCLCFEGGSFMRNHLHLTAIAENVYIYEMEKEFRILAVLKKGS